MKCFFFKGPEPVKEALFLSYYMKTITLLYGIRHSSASAKSREYWSMSLRCNSWDTGA